MKREEEDRKILLRAATHGTSPTGTSEPRCSVSRGEESVAGGASGTARLQHLSAPETGGRQPRIWFCLAKPFHFVEPRWRTRPTLKLDVSDSNRSFCWRQR